MGDNMKNLIIEKAKSDDLEKVQEFYRSRNYNQAINSECTISVARINGEIIGVVRICLESNVLILRGMQIKPEFHRQGIGSKMLAEVKKILEEKECFGIPYKHLEKFYDQIGFKKIEEQKAPDFLRKRIIEYRQKYPEKSFVLMKKSP